MIADIGQSINEKEIRMYLTTPHISKNVTDKNFKMHQKALLQMELPAETNLYSYSKGIKKPQIWTDNYGAIKHYLKENNYTFEKETYIKNQIPTLTGNNLYYCKEFYKKK